MPVIRRLAAPLREQVVDEMRRSIVSGRYAPDSRLIERELCLEFEVSRSVIREALRQLESERLVRLVPNTGPVVRSLTVAEARGLYEVRATLESLAGRNCAVRADDAIRRALMEAMIRIETTDPRDIDAMLAAKDAFTAALVAGSGNEIIDEMLSSVHARVNRMRALTMQAPGRIPQTIEEIRAILTAVLNQDPDAAEAACRTHVEAAAEIAIAALVE